jgi:hypothetical protein
MTIIETPALAGTEVGEVPAGAGPRPRVLGLDLSLTSTGVASNAGGGWSDTIRPKRLTGLDRMTHIRSTLLDLYVPDTGLIVVEGPSFGSSGAGSHERAGLWWLVMDALRRRDIPLAVVPPKNRAQYAFGKGDANKREVLAGVGALFPQFDVTHRPGLGDEADAFILAAMGADWLGYPLVEVPANHRKALDGCEWPDLSACGVTTLFGAAEVAA